MDRSTSEWKVYFEGSFWGHSGRDHAGQEVPINKDFFWGSRRCYVPAAYLRGKGLVLDLCVRVPAGEIRAFMDKWALSEENDDPSRFTREQRQQLRAENPLDISIRPTALVNGRVLPADRGCGLCWNPCLQHQEPEILAAMAHYGLDPAWGWAISRHRFPWAARRRPALRTLSVTLAQSRMPLPGPRFRAAPGHSFQFRHPATGITHTLTVAEVTPQVFPKDACPGCFPDHFLTMEYRLSPELPREAITVCDCQESDPPRPVQGIPENAACIGIIGGSDGPTALILDAKESEFTHIACSSLHFDPPEDVEWRIVFHEKLLDDHTEVLL